jgi:hypothetical protein
VFAYKLTRMARAFGMANPLTLSLWLGVVLYAAVGFFGVFFIHDAAPVAQDLTGGYGIAYRD